MKKLKNPSIDKYGLCLNEYRNNKNNAEVYFKRAVGLYPEMETSKAIANITVLQIFDRFVFDSCKICHFPRVSARFKSYYVCSSIYSAIPYPPSAIHLRRR